MSGSVRLVSLEQATAEQELATVGALLDALPAATLVVTRLSGDAAALGRYQRVGRSGHTHELRRFCGGRSLWYGAGAVSICALLPDAQAWLRDTRALSGAQLLNRYVRGLLGGLAKLGLSPAYPGRDFISANGRRVGYLSFERDARDVFLFQAVIGVERALATAEPDPVFPGLPPYPRHAALAELLAGAVSSERVARALQDGMLAQHELTPEEVAAPPDGHAPTHEIPAGARAGRVVALPIGELQAHALLEPSGVLREIRFCGDWIAGSKDVALLEQALIGAEPQGPQARASIERWHSSPATLLVGAPSAEPLVEAVRSLAEPERA